MCVCDYKKFGYFQRLKPLKSTKNRKKMLHFYQRLINAEVLLKAIETYTHKDGYYFFLHALNHQ